MESIYVVWSEDGWAAYNGGRLASDVDKYLVRLIEYGKEGADTLMLRDSQGLKNSRHGHQNLFDKNHQKE